DTACGADRLGLSGRTLAPRVKARPAADRGGTGPMSQVTVLLADDQRLVRESLATLVGLLDGVELVATASDGEQACALAAEHEPQVVLMDLRMPRMDGIEA